MIYVAVGDITEKIVRRNVSLVQRLPTLWPPPLPLRLRNVRYILYLKTSIVHLHVFPEIDPGIGLGVLWGDMGFGKHDKEKTNLLGLYDSIHP